MKMSKNKKKILCIVAIIVVILIATLGISVAVFTKALHGEKENTITSGSVSFKYVENSTIGNGINIEDAEPISDAAGKVLNTYFDFTIEAKPSMGAITYQVVVEPTAQSTVGIEGIKFYLTELGENDVETEVSQTIGYNGKVKTLSQYEDTTEYGNGKITFVERIEKGSSTFTKRFRARMWLAEDVEWDAEEYFGKTGAFKINVYANSSNALDAAHLIYVSKINPETNEPYTNCTTAQCAIDELFEIANGDD